MILPASAVVKDEFDIAVKADGGVIRHRTSELHARVAAFVTSTGITINDFISKAIVNELEHDCSM